MGVMRSFTVIGSICLLYLACVVKPSHIQHQQEDEQDILEQLATRILDHKENELQQQNQRGLDHQQDQRGLDHLANRMLVHKKNNLIGEELREKKSIESQESLSESLITGEKDGRQTTDVNMKATLKREILHALLKLLHDEQNKKSSMEDQQQQQRRREEVLQHHEAHNDVKKSATREKVADEVALEKAPNDATADAAISHEDMEMRAPPSAKRSQKRIANQERIKDKARRSEDVENRELIRGPPGLWGRDALEKEARFRSLRGPPGLWGKDAVDLHDEVMREKRNFLARFREERTQDEKSRI